MSILCQPCDPLGKVLVRKWSRVSRGEQVDLKTGETPKQSTIEKYNKDMEVKERMEEVVFCQPCEKEFYKKNGRWHCLCDKRITYCSNTKCKAIGLRLGLKIGGAICKHNKIRSECKPCGGSQVCEHNKQRSRCKLCKGGSICEHNRERSRCKLCEGGQICEHNRRRSRCKLCKGSEICEHNKQRSTCKICDPQGHIAHSRRSRRQNATRSPNPTRTLDDLCMTSKEWLKYLHKTFEDTYGRPKTEKDEVNIDEIIPCSAWNLPDDNKYCWHYLNSQWLTPKDNLEKGDSYEEEDKVAMIKRIDIALSEIKTRVSI